MTRDGKRLTIDPRVNTEFSCTDARISFITGPAGRTTSLISHTSGVDLPMQRVDARARQSRHSRIRVRPEFL